MELLGKAARVFSGIPVEPKGRQHGDGKTCLSAEAEAEARVVLPPKMRETFADPSASEGKSDSEREKRIGSLLDFYLPKQLKQPAEGHIPLSQLT
jgi:hypothetical protein